MLGWLCDGLLLLASGLPSLTHASKDSLRERERERKRKRERERERERERALKLS